MQRRRPRTRWTIIWLVVAVLSVVAVSGRAQGPYFGRLGGAAACTPLWLSDNSHPRMVLNNCTMPDQISRITAGGAWQSTFQAMVDVYSANWGSLVGVSCDSTATCGTYALGLAYQYAVFDSVVGINWHGRTKTDFAVQAKAVLDYAQTVYSFTAPNYGGWRFALAYDWIYPTLTPTYRNQVVTWFSTTTTSGTAACQYPPVSADLTNSQLTTCWTSQAAMATSAKGDGFQTAWVDATYANINNLLWASTTGVINWESQWLGTTGGDWSEGTSYGSGYTMEGLFPVAEAWRTSQGLTKSTVYSAANANVFHYWPRWMLSLLEPWNEGASTHALYSTFRTPPRYLTTEATLVRTAQWVQGAYDGVDADAVALARWLQQNITGELDTSGVLCLRYCGEYLLFGPSTIQTAQSPTTQGIATAYKAGTTRWVFVENWADADAGKVWIDTQQWQRGDTIKPRHPGAIKLSRNGWINGPAGGDSNFPSTDFWAGASSGMTFPDRSTGNLTTAGSPPGSYDDQGSVRRTVSSLFSAATVFTPGSAFELIRTTVRESFAGGGSTLSAIGQDLSCSYDSSCVPDPGGTTFNPTRVSTYYMSAGVATLSDRVIVVSYHRTVTLSTNYVQTYLIHAPVDFAISASSTTANTPVYNPAQCSGWTCLGTGAGYTTYGTVTWPITATQTASGASGKLWVTCQLPTTCGTTVVKSGGTSGTEARCADLFARRQTCSAYAGIQALYGSFFRLELTAATPATNQNFMVVEELTDSGGSQSTTTTYTGGSQFDCSGVGTIGFCFGKTGESNTSGTAILSTVITNTEWKWGGLAPGTMRTFTPGANIDLGSGAGVAVSKTVDSGGYVSFADIDVSGAGSGAANTITVS